MTTRDKILEAIKEIPTKKIPFGTYKKLAKEFNSTPMYVASVCHEQGYSVRGTKRARNLCYQCVCGKIQKSANLCYDCRYVELPCASCGKPVKRLASLIVWQLRNTYFRVDQGNPGWNGKWFCDRRCTGFWMGKQNKKIEQSHE